MSVGLLGRKVGMTQIYDSAGEDSTGEAIPVTVIQAGPCSILQVKTLERDGYEAVQLGYLDNHVVLPAAVLAATSPSSTANASAGAQPLVSRRYRSPIASLSGLSASCVVRWAIARSARS